MEIFKWHRPTVVVHIGEHTGPPFAHRLSQRLVVHLIKVEVLRRVVHGCGWRGNQQGVDAANRFVR